MSEEANKSERQEETTHANTDVRLAVLVLVDVEPEQNTNSKGTDSND